MDREESRALYDSLEYATYRICYVITDDGFKLVVGGKTEELLLQAVEVLGQKIADGSLFDDSGAVTPLEYSHNIYGEYQDFEVVLGEEIVVAQGEKTHWGYYQFPNITYLADGSIQLNWSIHNDSATEAWEGPSQEYSVSQDGGLTWSEKSYSAGGVAVPSVQMSNGKYFAGFGGRSTFVADYLHKYTPRAQRYGKTIYLADDIEERDRTFTAFEYDPVTKKRTSFVTKVNWPNMPLAVYTGDIVYPTQSFMSITSADMGTVAIGDALYFCTYANTVGKISANFYYGGYYSVFVFKSTDNARSWDMISEIHVTPETLDEGMEGFCEPSMDVMPDGSVVMLMRTGGNRPSYLVRSVDGCMTWSDPVKFDDVGVLPQILTLECGVTVATYGRDGLFLRATSDYAGLDWEEHIQIQLSDPVTHTTQSCYYTRLLPLGKDSFLMAYSDFNYPNQNGEGTLKTVLVRKITIVPKS